MEFKSSFQQPQAFPHTPDAKAGPRARRMGVKTSSLIRDGEQDRLFRAFQPDFSPGCGAVAFNIA